MPVKDVTIVTGASSGIGRAVALRLAGAGRTVVTAARRAAELDTLVAEIAAAGGSAVAVPTDVTSSATWRTWSRRRTRSGRSRRWSTSPVSVACTPCSPTTPTSSGC